jgi:hypothetical protein
MPFISNHRDREYDREDYGTRDRRSHAGHESRRAPVLTICRLFAIPGGRWQASHQASSGGLALQQMRSRLGCDQPLHPRPWHRVRQVSRRHIQPTSQCSALLELRQMRPRPLRSAPVQSTFRHYMRFLPPSGAGQPRLPAQMWGSRQVLPRARRRAQHRRRERAGERAGLPVPIDR